MIPISDIKVKLDPMPDRRNVLATTSFVVAGAIAVKFVKVIRTAEGREKVVFPEQPSPCQCHACRKWLGINHRFCPWCAAPQPRRVPELDGKGRPKKWREFMYPVSAEAHREIERVILDAYLAELGVGPRLAVLPESA